MTNLIRLNPFRWPYSLQQLREDEPSKSFSNNPTDTEYAHYNVYHFDSVVKLIDPPNVNPATHKVEQTIPIYIDGVLTQQWSIKELTPEEAEAYHRMTHPPRWLEFWNALPSEVDGLLRNARDASPRLELGLGVGLGKAADGDISVFLKAWNDAKNIGLIPHDLANGIITLAMQYDLPQDFLDGL